MYKAWICNMLFSALFGHAIKLRTCILHNLYLHYLKDFIVLLNFFTLLLFPKQYYYISSGIINIFIDLILH